MLLKEEKTAIIENNRTHETDTGSPEVQIAILTQRINDLTAHLRRREAAQFLPISRRGAGTFQRMSMLSVFGS